MTKKIAIIQGGAYGDNINSTLMLRPLHRAFFNCKITVYTSDLYGSAFDNNPYIDQVIKRPAADKLAAINLCHTLREEVDKEDFDLIIADHPMHCRDKWYHPLHQERHQNIIHTWINSLQTLGITIDQPETILMLNDNEVHRAQSFVALRNPFRSKVLMEVSGESGQTYWSPQWTRTVVPRLIKLGHDVLISCKHQDEAVAELSMQYPSNVFWVGDLTLRECAEVFNHCRMFLSVSSGLSNVCNTSWCRRERVTWFEAVADEAANSSPLGTHNKKFYYGQDPDEYAAMIINHRNET